MIGLKAVLFDLDGTLSDSLGALRAAYEAFLHSVGQTGNEHEFDALNGPPLTEIITYLVRAYSLRESPEILRATYEAIIHAEMSRVRPMNGAADLMQTLCKQDLKVAVVTSAAPQSAKDWLSKNKLMCFVDVLVGGTDVFRGKPAPDPYLLALALLDVVSEEAIAIEDSKLGATSAQAAGLKTYVLTQQQEASSWPNGVTFLKKLPDLIEVHDAQFPSARIFSPRHL